MGDRGRTSQAQLSVVTPISSAIRQVAPPPRTLTKGARELWVAITDRMPADWFTAENLPLLEAYCRAVNTHWRVSAALQEFDDNPEWLESDEGVTRFKSLAQVQASQAQVMKTLATAMRLTQQARYYADKAGRHGKPRSGAGGGQKPWERNRQRLPVEINGDEPDEP